MGFLNKSLKLGRRKPEEKSSGESTPVSVSVSNEQAQTQPLAGNQVSE